MQISSKFSATIDLTDVERGLREMSRAGKNLGPVFKALRPLLKVDQREHAKARSASDGAWPARAKSTLTEYRKRGKTRHPRPLGKLLTAVQYVAKRDSVTARSLIPWSGAHQEGAVVGHGAKLPAREFLWISNTFLDKAEQLTADHVLRGFGGG